MPPPTKHLKISGRVQGVGFRYYTRQQAKVLGVNGWVKNCVDGSVEVALSGEEKTLEEMINRLWIGPRPAHVQNIREISSESDETGPGFDSFHIKR